MFCRMEEEHYFTTETLRTPSLSESLHRILCVSESLWFLKSVTLAQPLPMMLTLKIARSY